MDTNALVRWLNTRHQSAWVLAEALTGGLQHGAWLVIGPHGERAALKWSIDGGWARRALAAAPVVRLAREVGWPTPAWLAVGSLPAGGGYVLLDWASGTPLSAHHHPPSREELALVLQANARQADLHPATDRDWSTYAHGVVTGQGSNLIDQLRGHSAVAARLVARLEAWTAPYRSLPLPVADVVHGDYSLSNILMHDGKVTLVDAEASGKGTRVLDLAALLQYAALHGAAPVDIAMVRDAAVGVGGWGVYVVSLAWAIVELAAWGARHWPGGDVEGYVSRSHALLDQYGQEAQT